MTFKELSQEDKDIIRKKYKECESREKAQQELSEYFQ